MVLPLLLLPLFFFDAAWASLRNPSALATGAVHDRVAVVNASSSSSRGGDTGVPRNPYLSKAAYPITHGNTFCTDSVGPRSIERVDEATFEFLDLPGGVACPITLAYSNDGNVLWGSTFTGVFKVDRRGPVLRMIDFIRKGWDEPLDLYHGAYSFVDQDDDYYVAMGDRIERYGHKDPGKSLSGMVKLPERAHLPPSAAGSRFRGVSVAYDGTIIYITSNSVVGAVRRGSLEHITSYRFPDDDTISNSIAIDEDHGIYVVTSRSMNKLRWDPSDQTLHLVWSTPYGQGVSSPGRLGEGSGTTPTIIGSKEKGGGRMAVICDGSAVMNVLFFDCETGLVVGQAPVTFGNATTIFTTTEQSVTGHGYRVMVTSNDYRNGTWIQGRFEARNRSRVAAMTPITLGDAPKGLEQFEIDPRTGRVSTTWVNRDVSVPNGIPHLSVASGLVYGVSKSHGQVFEAGPGSKQQTPGSWKRGRGRRTMARSQSRSPPRRREIDGAGGGGRRPSPDRRDRKRSRSPERNDRERRKEEAERAGKRAKAEEEYKRKKRMEVVKQMTGGDLDESDGEANGAQDMDDDDDLDDEERAMKKLLGFANFDSTKGKPVEDNQKGPAKGTARKGSTRTYRQYMNRKGGFNRPLDRTK